MRWVSIIVFLLGCSPDLDEFVASADEILLPADPSLPKTDENTTDKDATDDSCRECALFECSAEYRDCIQDNKCYNILEEKSASSNPNELINADIGYKTNNANVTPQRIEEARRKYQSYFDCVFWYNCADECDAGKLYKNCVDDENYIWESDFSLPQTSGESIELKVRINQIMDIWPESYMTSPGEHCVFVQWLDSNILPSNNDELNKLKFGIEQKCMKGEDISEYDKDDDSWGYTNDFGEVILRIPIEQAAKEKEGAYYLRIERGNAGTITYEDLGPFLYYLDRPFLDNQDVTINLPPKAMERVWTATDFDIATGSIVTVLVYDCLGIPARGIQFSLTIQNSNLSPNFESWDLNIDETGALEFWNPITINQTGTTSSLGMGSFYITNPPNSSGFFKGTLTEPTPYYKGPNDFLIEQGGTSFIVLYPKTDQ